MNVTWLGVNSEPCSPGLRLTQLTLPGRHSVTDSGLVFLSRLALLSGLDLTDYTQVTDQGVGQLSCMTRSEPSHVPSARCHCQQQYQLQTSVLFFFSLLQVEDAVAQQHSGDRRRTAVPASHAGPAGALPGPDGGHQQRSGPTHPTSAAAAGHWKEILTDRLSRHSRDVVFSYDRVSSSNEEPSVSFWPNHCF